MDITNVWVVIAAYNEQQVIGETVANVLAEVGNVVVVDDCSADDTAQKPGATESTAPPAKTWRLTTAGAAFPRTAP